MILIIIGAAVVVISLLVFAATEADYQTCQNALVGAFESGPCTKVTFWHIVTTWSMIAGIILFGLAVWIERKRRHDGPPQA